MPEENPVSIHASQVGSIIEKSFKGMWLRNSDISSSNRGKPSPNIFFRAFRRQPHRAGPAAYEKVPIPKPKLRESAHISWKSFILELRRPKVSIASNFSATTYSFG